MSDGAARWQRLQEIVQATLDRPVDARAAFLDEACGGDEDLRREAASLLAQDDRASAFLATPLAELAAGAVTYSPGGTPMVDDSRNLIGTRLGAYEIRARLGAGGMGEVYRARDHELHRDVAIKVLPAAFAADPERLVRFEREARLLASLNHSHIGAVYGLAGDGHLRGIVLELIDGETLEARLAKGPVPIPQALSLALQIARALDHAHQHGVMHRDLKPANIMLTKSGAKLLDFGLAKWGAPRSGYSPSPGSAGARPEGVESVTSEGTILGTLHYMAPEQLEGKHVDARADVFAFGAVLYEMLTGRRAFDGGSAAAVMASVLNTEPALDTVKRLASPGLERIVRKCLAKDPDNRWQTVRDLADELEWISDDAGRAQPVVADRGARPVRLNRWVALGVAALALVLAGWVGSQFETADEPFGTRAPLIFTIMPSVPSGIGAFDISEDGSALVYLNVADKRRLYIRRFADLTDVLIPGTENADEVAFSPDGQWVAFYSGERLLKVNVRTMAAPILLWEGAGNSLNRSTVWIDEHTILTVRDRENVPDESRGSRGQVMLVPAEGGEPQAVTTFTETPPEEDHHSPVVLPGGKALIFSVHDKKGGRRVVAQELSTDRKAVGERQVLVEGFDPQYVSTGHLVFGRGRSILAVPFDAGQLKVTGAEVTLVEDAQVDPGLGNASYRVSKNGTLVVIPGQSIQGRRFVWVDRSGVETPVPLDEGAFTSPSISPDGRLMAFAKGTRGRRDILTYEFATGKITPFTREGNNHTPIWTPGGQRLTFASNSRAHGGTRALFSQNPGGAPEYLASEKFDLVPGVWSPNGKALLYWGGGQAFDRVYSVAVDGDRKPTRLELASGIHRQPSLSPDGRWIAYSAEIEAFQVFVSNYPELTVHHQVSIDGGREPRWSRDGKEIVYRSFTRMLAASVDTTRGFYTSKPRLIFDRDFAIGDSDGSFGNDYDLAPDGRFLMMKRGPREGPLGLRVTLNWVDELVRRVPTNQ
jgi:Tol biopolymer transport system component